MKQSKHLILLLTIWLLMVVLVACAPKNQWLVGIDSFSPNGEWATYNEYSDNPVGWKLVLLNLDREESAILATEGQASFQTSFSPNGPYLLYQDSSRWYLVDYSTADPTSNQREIHADDDETLQMVQFLPEGELLIMTQDLSGWKKLYTINDLAGFITGSEIRNLFPRNIRYGFPGEGATEMQTGIYQILFQYLNLYLPDQYSGPRGLTRCDVPVKPEVMRWALVDEDNNLLIFSSNQLDDLNQDVHPESVLLDLKENFGIKILLDLEDCEIQDAVSQSIQIQANEKGVSLTADELQAQVDEQLGNIPYPSTVLLSPMEEKLLMLRMRSSSKEIDISNIMVDPLTSLILIDLLDGSLKPIRFDKEENSDSEENSDVRKNTQRSEYIEGFLVPYFSPDGSKILVLHIASSKLSVEKTLYSLYLIDLEVENFSPKLLSKHTDWSPEFAFSPDGRQILYETEQGSGRALFLAKSDGSDPIRVGDQEVVSFCWHH